MDPSLGDGALADLTPASKSLSVYSRLRGSTHAHACATRCLDDHVSVFRKNGGGASASYAVVAMAGDATGARARVDALQPALMNHRHAGPLRASCGIASPSRFSLSYRKARYR
jgi:hypothetical protein